jgi:hypothetical protein
MICDFTVWNFDLTEKRISARSVNGSVGANGDSKKMFIEANPQYKTVTVYDNQMKRMQKEDLSQYHSLQHAQGKEVKQEQRQEVNQNKKKAAKQQPGKDDSLLPKKRIRQKKGLKI